MKYNFEVSFADEPEQNYTLYNLTYEKLFRTRPDLAPAVQGVNFQRLEYMSDTCRIRITKV